MKKVIMAVITMILYTGLVMAQEQPDAVPVFSDPAKNIEVKTGQEFVIELDANRTTGYQWQLSGPLDNSILKQLGSEYRASKTGLVGAGGKEIWKFKAAGQGKTTIAMKYIRPWEKNIPPVRELEFRLLIRN